DMCMLSFSFLTIRLPARSTLFPYTTLFRSERAMVEGYLQWLAETGVDSGLRVVASETYLEAPLDVPGVEVEVKLIGKIDVRVVREYDGARLFIDHKTTGSLTEPLKTIRLDPQMLHYHVLEWLSDVEAARCDGALYNMLRK